MARYLQTVLHLPTFSILALGNFIVLVVLGRYLWKRTDWHIIQLPIVWLFMGIVVIRSITNIASARFTLSIYVQLITQATPFIVILISTLAFREKLPRFTIPAICAALVGALMMIGTNFGTVANDPTRQDLLGVSLALASVIALAIYMVLIRRTVKYNVSGEALLGVQLISIAGVGAAASWLTGEDWNRYAELGISGWIVFLIFTFVVFLWANFGQIQSIQHIGAPFVSSLLAFRLVSALLFAALILNEHLQSIWQMAGAGIVLTTITWYLWQQRK